MEIGIIEWFDNNKGFGVLRTPNDIEVFFHSSNWRDSRPLTTLYSTPFVFEICFQRGKTTATNCMYFNPNDQEHWRKMASLDENQFYIRVDYQEINILEEVLSRLDKQSDFLLASKFLDDMVNNLATEAFFDDKGAIFKAYNNTKKERVKELIINPLLARVERLSDQEKIEFWRTNLVSDFTPDQEVLTKCHDQITASDLGRISNIDTRNQIILRKLRSLKENYDSKKYIDFQSLLEFIDNEELKKKIISDLNTIAKSHYFIALRADIEKLTKDSSTDYNSIITYLKHQPKFFTVETSDELLKILHDEIIRNCSFRTITDCWRRNLIEDFDDSVLRGIPNQNNDDLLYLLDCEKCSERIVRVTLDKFLKEKEFSMVLEQARRYDVRLFKEYDQLVCDAASEEEYFILWRNNEASIIPLEFIQKQLNHDKERYSELLQWLNSDRISKKEVIMLLTNCIMETPDINDRYKFYRVLYSIQTIVDIDANFQEIIEPIKNDFTSLILWHLKKNETFNFETLKGKFIYFLPDDQVNIFKRLFYLKNQGQLNFDLNKLDEIIRADLDLHLENEKINNDFVLDISTHIILEGLKSYTKTQSFVFESDLILKDLQKNSKRKFKIEKYFDLCQGRLTPSWNWNTNGKISQVYYDNGTKYYFSIEIEKGHPDFENLKTNAKSLPKAKWNNNAKHWGVPSKYKNEVYVFADRHNFFIHLKDGKHYENNNHLVEYSRYINEKNRYAKIAKKNIPIGITYCEGRKAKKIHHSLLKEFWWCCNQECFQNCLVNHLSMDSCPITSDDTLDECLDDDLNFLNEEICAEEPSDIWEELTLFDFLKILKINIDEHNGIDFIEDGHYYRFLGHINAFNRLLDHLYCEDCGNMLYPVNSSHFALYRDVKFHCIENNCSRKHQVIYLNHCLYGECTEIIDSRVSKQCAHGLYICSSCGTCCSEESFKRRLESLKKVGGYIHPELIDNVSNQNGHLEKKEYYCYKCSDMMHEISGDTYKCFKCDVKYDLGKFKWLDRKWTQKHRRRKDYPIYSDDEE
jgi:cold shock CspA family protein